MDEQKPGQLARFDDEVSPAWIEFLARRLKLANACVGHTLAEMRSVHSADMYLRSISAESGPFNLDDIFRHVRAIFDNPLRSIYPVLFPPEERTRQPIDGATFKVDEVSYGVRTESGRQQVFIANQFGVELLAAEVDPAGNLRPWSIRVLSLSIHELLYLGPENIRHLRTILLSPQFLQATKLHNAQLHRNLPSGLQANIGALAELPIFLAQMATNGCGPEGLPSFLRPNLAYEACCNAHDLCYTRGGTEQDRARCDENLARCIEAIGGGGLQPGGFAAGFVSFLYYTLVTVFGTPAFTYGTGVGVTDAHKVSQGHDAGERCSYQVKLVDITVKNAAAGGQTFEFEVTPDLEKQTLSNPGMLRRLKFPEVEVKGDRTIRFGSEPLTVKFGRADCGATVVLPLHVNDAHTVAGNGETKRFVCDGSSWDFTIPLSVAPATVSFSFTVETGCA
jgi:hypothetical protein